MLLINKERIVLTLTTVCFFPALLGCAVHRRDLPLLAVPACSALGATAPGAFSGGERAAAERVGGVHGALWSQTDWRVLWSH